MHSLIRFLKLWLDLTWLRGTFFFFSCYKRSIVSVSKSSIHWYLWLRICIILKYKGTMITKKGTKNLFYSRTRCRVCYLYVVGLIGAYSILHFLIRGSIILNEVMLKINCRLSPRATKSTTKSMSKTVRCYRSRWALPDKCYLYHSSTWDIGKLHCKDRIHKATALCTRTYVHIAPFIEQTKITARE